jgi:hypothetical protein
MIFNSVYDTIGKDETVTWTFRFSEHSRKWFPSVGKILDIFRLFFDWIADFSIDEWTKYFIRFFILWSNKVFNNSCDWKKQMFFIIDLLLNFIFPFFEVYGSYILLDDSWSSLETKIVLNILRTIFFIIDDKF